MKSHHDVTDPERGVHGPPGVHRDPEGREQDTQAETAEQGGGATHTQQGIGQVQLNVSHL